MNVVTVRISCTDAVSSGNEQYESQITRYDMRVLCLAGRATEHITW